MSKSRPIAVGDKAPDFTLPDATGKAVHLADLIGKKSIVLFFYPKDETMGCTREACSFRDSYDDFTAAGAQVIGISSDSSESHARFAAKHGLPMTLLADQGGKVRALFGVKSTLGILPGRVTYLIDLAGVVRYMFGSQLQFGQHVEKTLEMVRQLEQQAPGTMRAS